MNMQHSELPSAVSATIETQHAVGAETGKSRRWHIQQSTARRERRERERQEVAEAVALGVTVIPKLRFDRTWQPWEEAALHRFAADLDASMAALPHRSRAGIEKRRNALGLTPARAMEWRTTEDKIIRENYLKVRDAAGLTAMLPGRTLPAVQKRLLRLDLKIPPSAFDTGNDVVNAIKDRCRNLGYTMRDLDRIAKTGYYFTRRIWGSYDRDKTGRRAIIYSASISKAVNALGGELRVEWPD